MTTRAAAIDALRDAAQKRSDHARRAIEQAIRDLRRRRQPINVNAVARQSGVTRRTIYNHTDLLEHIRSHRERPRSSNIGTIVGKEAVTIASLRNELTRQKARYEKVIARLTADLHNLDQALAAAHGELRRLRPQPPPQ